MFPVDNNAKLGIYNSYDSYLTIESGANVTANHNGAHGIYNQVMGDLEQGAFLIESGANVTANYNTVSGIVNCNLFTVERVPICRWNTTATAVSKTMSMRR